MSRHFLENGKGPTGRSHHTKVWLAGCFWGGVGDCLQVFRLFRKFSDIFTIVGGIWRILNVLIREYVDITGLLHHTFTLYFTVIGKVVFDVDTIVGHGGEKLLYFESLGQCVLQSFFLAYGRE